MDDDSFAAEVVGTREVLENAKCQLEQWVVDEVMQDE